MAQLLSYSPALQEALRPCTHAELKGVSDDALWACNNEGDTILHIEAKRTESDIPRDKGHDKHLLEFLMSRGLNPLEEGKGRRSALDVAAACGKEQILGLFQRKKA